MAHVQEAHWTDAEKILKNVKCSKTLKDKNTNLNIPVVFYKIYNAQIKRMHA